MFFSFRIASLFSFSALAACLLLAHSPLLAQPKITIPTTGPVVAKSKQARQEARTRSDQAFKNLKAAEKADEEALAKFRASMAFEQRKSEALINSRNIAKLDYEAAQQANDDANAEYQRVRPRRGRAETQESLAAINNLRLAEKQEVLRKTAFERADRKLIQTAIPGPDNNMLLWVESQAKLRNAQALFNLAEKQYLLAHRRYVNILIANPPPFLKNVAIFTDKQKLYHARWEDDPAGKANPSKTYLALLDQQPRLNSAVKELDMYLDEQANLRIALAEKMRSFDPKIARDAAEYGNAKWWAVMGPAIVEGVAAGIDVFTTGGTATAAGKASELAMEKYIAVPGRQAVAKLAKTAAARSYTRAKARAISSGIGAGVGKGFVGTLMGSATDDRGNNRIAGPVENNSFIGADILLGDGFEIMAGSLAPDDATLLRTSQAVVRKGWDNKKAVRALAGRSLNWKNYLSNLKSGAPATIIESVVKVAVKRYFEGKANEADRRMMQRIAKATALNITFNQMRQDNFDLIELRKQHHIIMETLHARLSRFGTPLKLNVLTDKSATDSQLRKPLRVELTFSQPLSKSPSLLFAGNFLNRFRPAAGGRNVWSTSLQRHNVKNERKWPLAVFLGKGNQPSSHIDGKPQTEPEFDFVKAEWTDKEKLPDINHRLSLAESKYNLTGYWKSNGHSGEREVFITHDGDQLTAVHTKPDKYSRAIGDPDFNGKLTENSITGRVLGRAPPPHYAKCPQDYWGRFNAFLNDARLEIKMVVDTLVINVATCEKLRPTKVAETYTRLLDSEGKPITKKRR